MRKASINTLLTRAEQQFSLGKYESALTTYGVLLKEYPSHGDAKIGVFLCDIGLESGEEAQARPLRSSYPYYSGWEERRKICEGDEKGGRIDKCSYPQQ